MLKRDVIKKIVNSIGILKNDVVLVQFWGEDSDREILHDFSCEIAALGASPIEFQQSRIVNANLFSSVTEDCFNKKFFNFFNNVDVIIDLFMYQPVVPSSDFPKDKLPLYREYMSNLFNAFADKRKFVQIRVPTEDNALESGIEKNLFLERMTNAYDIDYEALKADCEERVNNLKGKSKVTIKTGLNHVLTLSLDDRNWCIDAGDGDLPCGEIFIAPVEEKTNGTVFFKEIFLESDNEPLHDTNVTIEIESGIIVNSSSQIVNDFIKGLPKNGNLICELGLGLNKNVTSLIGYNALDEKMYGTFHLGLGMNAMFGGKNTCVMHTDIVTTGEVIFE